MFYLRTTSALRYSAKRFYSSNLGKLVDVFENNGTRNIVLNDEKTRNSMSLAMLESLLKSITNNQHDSALRCIVLSAKGKVFSAGHNLKELAPECGSDSHQGIFNKCAELMDSIMKSPVPVIAKIDGLAAAAGCQLVATCDIVVCSDSSKFSTPGANFGIFCSTPGIAVARVVPRMKASYMLLTGLPISAQDALASGLVTDVVPANQLDQRVEEICDAIKHKSRPVIELGKRFFYAQLNMDVATAYSLGGQTMVQNLAMSDGKEGISSFIGKRKAVWTHKND